MTFLGRWLYQGKGFITVIDMSGTLPVINDWSIRQEVTFHELDLSTGYILNGVKVPVFLRDP